MKKLLILTTILILLSGCTLQEVGQRTSNFFNVDDSGALSPTNDTYTLTIPAYDCTGNTNSGKLTGDINGAITCEDDISDIASEFTGESYGMSTTTTIGFLGGLMSTASSTFTSNLLVAGGDLLVSVGNIGVGITNPDVPLSTSAAGDQIKFQGSSYKIGSTNGDIKFQSSFSGKSFNITDTSNNTKFRVKQDSGVTGIATTSPWGQLSVEGQGSIPELVVTGTDMVPDFIVDENGFCGIGDTNPSEKLSLSGGNMDIDSGQYIDFEGNISGGTWVMGRNAGSPTKSLVTSNSLNIQTAVGATDNEGITIGGAGNNTTAEFATKTQTVFFSGNVGVGTSSPYSQLAVASSGSQPRFIVEDSASPDSEPFIISSDGKVGINTISTGYSLDVGGNLRSLTYILGSGPDLSLIPVAGGQSVITSWHGLQLIGNKQSTVEYTPANIGSNDDFSVIIPVPDNKADKIGLIVQGAVSQTGDIMQWRDSNLSPLSVVDSSGGFGIATATPAVKLDVNGIIKTQPTSARTCNALAEGGIMYDSDDSHFYGCNGSAWVQLDN